MGFVLGLFAIFSILRYRTETMSPEQMTLLFLCIGIGLLNAAVPLSWQGLIGLNAIPLLLLCLSRTAWFLPYEQRCTVVYDFPERIAPAQRQTLIQDLEARTGLTINRAEVKSVDLLRNTAVLQIYHR